jgi:hypothetical protein
MRHRRLFDLRVRHDFYAGGGSPDLTIEPRTWNPDGARALARHRLLARPQPDGLEILAEQDADDQPQIRLAHDLTLGFDVHVTGSEFVHYTAPGPYPGPAAPTYRGSAPAGGTLTLAPVTTRSPRDVAASIEISGITANWLAAPPRFTLDLPARSALWVYYLTTARGNGATPQIHDLEPTRALVFEGEQLTPATDDPIGRRLLAHHPDRRCHRFTSTRPIACHRTPLRQLALMLGQDLLIQDLPNPAIHSHATLKVGPAEEPSNTLFRVIEY